MKNLNLRETGTVLAALRLYQVHMESNRLPDDIWDIATDGETIEALDTLEIDDLCEKLNS